MSFVFVVFGRSAGVFVFIDACHQVVVDDARLTFEIFRLLAPSLHEVSERFTFLLRVRHRQVVFHEEAFQDLHVGAVYALRLREDVIACLEVQEGTDEGLTQHLT